MITSPDICLTECGEQSRSGTLLMTEGDDHQFLIIMSSMRSILRINARQYYMQPFTFLFHPFEEGRISVTSQGNTAYRYMRLRISDHYIQRFHEHGLTIKETHTLANPLAVDTIWKLILPAMEQPVPGSELGMYAVELLFCLLFEATDGSVTRAAEVPHYDKLAALRYNIYLHPEKNWIIQDICAKLGISRPYFHKIYFAAFGTTCTQDVIASRIACSKKLLENTDDAVSTVSQLSGFETDVYFMRQFKRHVGMTPTAYRRIYRQTVAEKEREIIDTSESTV